MRARQDLVLKPEVRRVFAENFEVHGARKVWRQPGREEVQLAAAPWSGFVYVAFVIDAYAHRIVGWLARHTQASCSTRWNKHCMIASLCIVADWSIIRIAAANTSRSNTPSAWLMPESSRQSLREPGVSLRRRRFL
jgi:transposase InsO family protein